MKRLIFSVFAILFIVTASFAQAARKPPHKGIITHHKSHHIYHKHHTLVKHHTTRKKVAHPLHHDSMKK